MDRYLLSKKANSGIRAALIAVVLIAGTVLSPTAWAQSAELDAAFRQYQSLEKQAKYAEAIPYAQAFIELAKEKFGETHQIYAAGLNNLAGLYKTQGRYAQAEPLYKRALAIDEKVLGPDLLSTGISVGNLAADHPSGGGRGWGFLWGRAGHVVTNHHVVANAAAVAVRLDDGDPIRATVVGSAPDYDLAFLRLGDLPAGLQPISIRSISQRNASPTKHHQRNKVAHAEPFAVARTYPISPQGGCEKTQTCLTMAASPSRNTLAAPPRPRDGLVGSFYATYGVLQQR